MPEYRECLAHYLVAQSVFAAEKPHHNWQVHGIWVDGTEKERSAAPRGTPLRNGHVYSLSPNTTIKRGTNGAQTPVWPPKFQCPAKRKRDAPDPPSIEELELQDISYTGRTLVMDFRDLWLQVQYLTHTSVQFYTRSMWERSIAGVNKEVRGFKMGMAIEFDDYFLAFPSIDMVFQSQPVWSESSAALPTQLADVYEQRCTFIQRVVDWMSMRFHSQSKRDGLFTAVIRDANTVWGGVGVYTSSELAFLAGLSPFLRESEVFDSPSRTARLIEAFYMFAHKAHHDMWLALQFKHLDFSEGLTCLQRDLLRPCIQQGILAPTREQRMGYASWLKVYAKSRTSLPQRMAVLLDDYTRRLDELASSDENWVRNEVNLDDVFEPSYLRPALERADNLGHLVFGKEEWLSLGSGSDYKDPVTAYFNERGLLGSKTFLRQGHYTRPFLDVGELETRVLPKRLTYTYRASKVIWSLTPMFPDNLTHTLDKPKYVPIESVLKKDRDNMMFRYIVHNTVDVVVGPLEYCGNGHIVQGAGGKELLSICYADPQIGTYYAQKDYRGATRLKAQRDQPTKGHGKAKVGKRKGAMSLVEREKLEHAESLIITQPERTCGKENKALDGDGHVHPDDPN
ncbi:hypothetical protein BJ138DRAFT_1104858 [Hygrophoropsis aurantiaca]|uniref:Uncharacterized protein n=1 Tax=Hygrophoropsis aurantiaca TaxID=72124 RepID=A0ACB8A1B1_9AGAM|nr:hypothetical protein BJ138DRAFT_1104858 [Hygrophoropsis aurantiaca]